MNLENQFEVPRPPKETWEILLDVPKIVECVPGATLISEEPDGKYKGNVAVRLGPISLKFNGKATMTDVNDQDLSLTIHATGSDQKGRGGAGATSKVRVTPTDNGSLVVVSTELQLSGLVAQYGRASGVINAVADEIVTSFSQCLRQRLSEGVANPDNATEQESLDKERQSDPARVTNTPLGVGLFYRVLKSWLKGLVSKR